VGLLSAIAGGRASSGGRCLTAAGSSAGSRRGGGRRGAPPRRQPSWPPGRRAGPWGANAAGVPADAEGFRGRHHGAVPASRFGPAGAVITFPRVEDLLPVLTACPQPGRHGLHVDTRIPDDLELGPPWSRCSKHRGPWSSCNGCRPASAVQPSQHHHNGGPLAGHHGVGPTLVRYGRDPPLALPVAYQASRPSCSP